MHKLLRKKQYPHKKLHCTSYIRVVNGPTSSGPKPNIQAQIRPEPKNYFEAQIMLEKTKVQLGLKNLAMLPSYFNYIFVRLRQKVRLKPKFLSTQARPDLRF